MLLLYIHTHTHIYRTETNRADRHSVTSFYLPLYVGGLYVRLKIIKEPFVVGRMTYTFIYITDRKVCLCEFVLSLSLPFSFPFYLFRRFHQILISEKGMRRGKKTTMRKRREHRLQ